MKVKPIPAKQGIRVLVKDIEHFSEIKTLAKEMKQIVTKGD